MTRLKKMKKNEKMTHLTACLWYLTEELVSLHCSIGNLTSLTDEVLRWHFSHSTKMTTCSVSQANQAFPRK